MQNFDRNIFIFSCFHLYLQHGGPNVLALIGNSAHGIVKGKSFVVIARPLCGDKEKKRSVRDAWNVFFVIHFLFLLLTLIGLFLLIPSPNLWIGI